VLREGVVSTYKSSRSLKLSTKKVPRSSPRSPASPSSSSSHFLASEPEPQATPQIFESTLRLPFKAREPPKHALASATSLRLIFRHSLTVTTSCKAMDRRTTDGPTVLDSNSCPNSSKISKLIWSLHLAAPVLDYIAGVDLACFDKLRSISKSSVSLSEPMPPSSFPATRTRMFREYICGDCLRLSAASS
jgi:hypothetical protein